MLTSKYMDAHAAKTPMPSPLPVPPPMTERWVPLHLYESPYSDLPLCSWSASAVAAEAEALFGFDFGGGEVYSPITVRRVDGEHMYATSEEAGSPGPQRRIACPFLRHDQDSSELDIDKPVEVVSRHGHVYDLVLGEILSAGTMELLKESIAETQARMTYIDPLELEKYSLVKTGKRLRCRKLSSSESD